MVDLLQVAEVPHPLRHPIGDDEEAAAARAALIQLRLQLVEEDVVVADVVLVGRLDAGLLLERSDGAVRSRVDVPGPVRDQDRAAWRPPLGDGHLAGIATTNVPAAAAGGEDDRGRQRPARCDQCTESPLARHLSLLSGSFKPFPPAVSSRHCPVRLGFPHHVHVLGRPRELHVCAAARELLPVGLVGVRDEDGHPNVAGEAGRPAGSTSRGRASSRPSPRRIGSSRPPAPM